MSNNRLLFIRGHVDALRDLCGNMKKDSVPVKAVDLLKSKVEEHSDSRDTGAYYKAGYEVTRSVASWIDLMLKSAVKADERSTARATRTSTPVRTAKSGSAKPGSRGKGRAA